MVRDESKLPAIQVLVELLHPEDQRECLFLKLGVVLLTGCQSA